MWFLPAKNAAILTAACILYANTVISNIWQLQTTSNLRWPILSTADSGYEPAESSQSSCWLSYPVNKSLTPMCHVYHLCFCTSWEATNPDKDFPGQADFCFFFFMVILIAWKTKKSSAINLRMYSSIQYDLNFNCPFNCSAYNETHLLIAELTENPGPLLLVSFGGYSLFNRLPQSDGSILVWSEVQSPLLSIG